MLSSLLILGALSATTSGAELFSYEIQGAHWRNEASPQPEEKESQILIYSSIGHSDQLSELLSIRFPKRELVVLRESEDNWKAPEHAALINFRSSPGHSESGYVIDIILSDGRAYTRLVQVFDSAKDSDGKEHSVDQNQLLRTLASVCANLLIGIEAEEIKPALEDVSLPEEATELAQIENQIEAQAAAAPEVQSVASSDEDKQEALSPDDQDEGSGESTSSDQDERFTTPPDLESSNKKALPHGLSIDFGPSFLVGAGSSFAFRGVGGFGGLAFGFSPSFHLRAEVRGLGFQQQSTYLSRLKAGLGIGYQARADRFLFPLTLMATAEGWWLGQTAPNLNPGPPALLWGGALDFLPTVQLTSESKTWSFQLGLRLALNLSAELKQGIGLPRIVERSGESPIFELGGFESELGLVLRVQRL